MAKVLVLNPNSTVEVTAGLERSLQSLQGHGGLEIECATLAVGPPGIETDQHVADVAGPVAELFAARSADCDAFVIACFSDPGLALARQRVLRPVFGMAESGYLGAAARGAPFGVVSILSASLGRHRRQMEALGVVDQLAADLPLELGVVELLDEARTRARLSEVGTRLRDEHGARSLLLGCAGMSAYRAELADELGVPVVDPVHAAVEQAAEQLAR